MAAGKYSFIIEQGSTVSFEIAYKDPEGNPINLTNYQAKMEIRPEPGSDEAYISLSSTKQADGTGLSLNGTSGLNPPESGTIGVYISAYSSSRLDFSRAHYDLEVVSPSLYVTRVLEGNIDLYPETTKGDYTSYTGDTSPPPSSPDGNTIYITSSYALLAENAFQADTIFPFSGDANFSGSVHLTGSFIQSGSNSVYLKGLKNQTTPTTHVVTYNNTTGQLFITGSSNFGGTTGGGNPGDPINSLQYNNGGVLGGSETLLFTDDTLRFTGSLLISGTIEGYDFIGDLTGTASYSEVAFSSSYASSSTSASYSEVSFTSTSSSYSEVAFSASYASSSTSASYSYTSLSASYASSSTSASYASVAFSASYASSSTSASYATNALTASYAANVTDPFPYTGDANIKGDLTLSNGGGLTAAGNISGSNLNANNATLNSIKVTSNITPVTDLGANLGDNGLFFNTASLGYIRTLSSHIDFIDPNTRDTRASITLENDTLQLTADGAGGASITSKDGIFSGNVTASNFVGDGTNLTNVVKPGEIREFFKEATIEQGTLILTKEDNTTTNLTIQTSSYAEIAGLATPKFPYEGPSVFSGSFIQTGNNDVYLKGLLNLTSSQDHVVTFNNTTGRLFVTNSRDFVSSKMFPYSGEVSINGSTHITGSLTQQGGDIILGDLSTPPEPTPYIVVYDNDTGKLHVTGSPGLIGGGEGSGLPGGDNNSIQFNADGLLDGSNKFTYIPAINTLSYTGSFYISGSIYGDLIGTASYATNAQTASYIEISQTASYVENAQTASYVETAQTASYVVLAQTASYVETAQTASYVETAQTASYVETAQTASYVTLAQTASYVENAQTASYIENAQTASYVETAQTASYVLEAISSSFSLTASYAINAENITFVENAESASHSEFAEVAGYVEIAQTASYVTLAQTASYVENAQTASYVTLAQTASYIETAQTASYVENAISASYSTTASYSEYTNIQNLNLGDLNATLQGVTEAGNVTNVPITASGGIYVNSNIYTTESTVNTLFLSASSANISNELTATFVTASYFSGNGSGLTGVTATSVDVSEISGELTINGNVIISHPFDSPTINSSLVTHSGILVHGKGTSAGAAYSHAEGEDTIAGGVGSHAEGYNAVVFAWNSSSYAHAEGANTTAYGYASHAEGIGTEAWMSASHAMGIGTVASASGQTAMGTYNLANPDALLVIGNGTGVLGRSNVAVFKSSSIEFNTDFIVNGTNLLTELNSIQFELEQTDPFPYTGSLIITASDSVYNNHFIEGDIFTIRTNQTQFLSGSMGDTRIAQTLYSTSSYFRVRGPGITGTNDFEVTLDETDQLIVSIPGIPNLSQSINLLTTTGDTAPPTFADIWNYHQSGLIGGDDDGTPSDRGWLKIGADEGSPSNARSTYVAIGINPYSGGDNTLPGNGGGEIYSIANGDRKYWLEADNSGGSLTLYNGDNDRTVLLGAELANQWLLYTESDTDLDISLGVGTQTPQEKLHIHGNVRISPLTKSDATVYEDYSGSLFVEGNTELTGSLSINSDQINFTNLPTSDPGVSGRLFQTQSSDGYQVVCISQG